MSEPRFTANGVWEDGRLFVDRRAAGYVGGVHFTSYVDEVKHLKRIGDYSAARQLLLRLVEANEAEAHECNWGVAPWYYEQLAIIYRKTEDLDGELAILERYDREQHAAGASPQKLAERLAKVRELVSSRPKSV